MGRKVTRVTNLIHHIKKYPLHLFRIDLKVADNYSEILKNDLLLHADIKM
jgi:hypothetical protein